jgi:hypothetical protein
MTDAVTIECGACGWSELVREPEGGQTLVGTAAEKLARHEGQTGCHNSMTRTKPTAGVDLWEMVRI